MKKKTHEQFVKEVYDLFGDEYSVQSEYINARTKINIKHNICNNIYKMKPNHILRGVKCPICSHNKKKTTEDFKKDIFNLVKNEYELLSEYKGANKNVLIRHNICGNEYQIKPNSFLNGKRCMICYLNNKKLYQKITHDEFCKILFNIVGDEYICLSEYKGVNKKIILKHTICSHEFEVQPNNFINSGTRCPKCSGLMKKNTEIFRKEVFDIVNNEYDVLGEYINSKVKILMKHNICNHKWYITPNSFLKGIRCPECAESKGEIRVRAWLKLNNINFVSQKEFEGLVGLGHRNLSYDFYLQNFNVLLEYQGEYHDGTAKNQSKKEFEYQQEHDRRKRDYAQQHGIELLEIWYWDFDNIEKILEEKLLKN